MTALLEVPVVSDADLRRTMRGQIAKLEAQLIAMPWAPEPEAVAAGDRGARIPSTAELEEIRDDLVRRIQERRFDGGEEQERKRILRERIALDPAAYRGVTVSNAEVGEPGCTRWSNWFRLRISGGCP